MKKTLFSSLALVRARGLAFVGAALSVLAQPAHAVFVDPNIPIPTQLLSFGPIQGEAFLPLTDAATSSSATGAPAATGDGYGWVNTNIAITLSTTTASTGEARLGLPFGSPIDISPEAAVVGPGCLEGSGAPGDVNTGDTVCVSSFFDVYFDVTLSDADSTTGFFGDTFAGPLGASDLGPATVRLNAECIADTSKPNLGCLPPTGNAYIGHFQVVLPLGFDVNGNGNDDVIKFNLVQHDVGGVTNTFIQGSTVIDTFDSAMSGDGSVGDAISDPPFTFSLTGPTTAQQQIIIPAQVPEPATLALFATGLGLLARQRKKAVP